MKHLGSPRCFLYGSTPLTITQYITIITCNYKYNNQVHMSGGIDDQHVRKNTEVDQWWPDAGSAGSGSSGEFPIWPTPEMLAAYRQPGAVVWPDERDSQRLRDEVRALGAAGLPAIAAEQLLSEEAFPKLQDLRAMVRIARNGEGSLNQDGLNPNS